MEETIFDLQTDVSNLIVQHGFADKDFAMIYQNGHLMIIDLSQAKIQQAVKNNLQNTENDV